ncbi:efflux RND transporter permease subunit [Anaeromicrobium sediminis]|uniref:Transporter n=1 Tax=Anaeromicrobium sediminis TaxID=1478221 RepID=A0A267MJQ3_9FIRM|nr:efflux RND transporter permease subunit [Anaeromicrobium sediminis]PAB59105.1 hypothetical protein CCE28_11340 [Anaeromicrobium sediminis]
MSSLIKVLIQKRRVTLFLSVIIAVMGALSYHLLPRQESPDVAAPYAMVVTPYPGASPKDVNDLVSKKIEDKLAQLEGCKETESISNDSVSIVVISFFNGTNNDKAMQDVRNAVADVSSELPKGCLPSEVNTDLVKTAGIIISLSGEKYSYEQLASFGKQFKDKLMDIDGISKFTIEGELKKQLKVKIDMAKMNQLGISFEDIYNILRSQNIEIPSGSIKTESGKIKVKTSGIYTSLQDVKDTIIGISPQTGVVTKLSDIAHIVMENPEDVQKYKQNGKNAVLLTGFFQKGKNVVIIGKDVRKAIDNVKSTLPEDLIVEEVVYQPDSVSKSTNDFMINLVEGIILVIIVVFLGMGMRNAVVVSAAIPMSILMTFIVMYAMKIYIHQMSLTALIVALGVLVDNAIVISDTIQVRIDGGEERIEASFKGTSMSAVPIFTATLTTVAAFSPLLGIPGAAGDFLKSIPQVLIISIIAAYIVSMFITPAMATIFFKKSNKKNEKEGWLRVFFKNLLVIGLKRKITVTSVTFITLILVIQFVMPVLPQEFFPFADKNILYIDITSEKSGDIETTEKLTDQVVNLLSKEKEITSYTVSIGTGMPKFYVTLNPPTPSNDFAQMVCKFDLGDEKDRKFNTNSELSSHIQTLLDENIPSGNFSVQLLALAEPGAKIRLNVSGESVERIKEVSDLIRNEIKKIEGTTNVRHNMNDKTLQYLVKIDGNKATNLGISKYDIQRQVNIALYGAEASVYRKDGKEYDILVKSPMNKIEDLENLQIKSSITGKKVPIKQYGQVTYESKLDQVNRFKRKLTIQIKSDVLPGYNSSEIANIIETELLPKLDISGVNIQFKGEREDIADTFGNVILLAGLAIFLIYVILFIQFDSFIQPIVIMMTVPLSLIGCIIGLYLFNQPLSLTAFLGIIALIGLVVKNGILLIEYINDARKGGYDIDHACIDSVDKRFNAIVLSAATTIMGLVPLALSGSSLFAPMAVSLMAGLIVSTFLTMVVIPVIYSLIETFLEKVNNRRKEASL